MLTKAQTEAIARRLKQRHGQLSGVFWHPDIPAKKMTHARKRCEVGRDETIVILVDCTVFGSAKNCLLFGAGGIYLHNGWDSSQSGAHHIKLDDFLAGKTSKMDKHNVWVVEDWYINISGCMSDAPSVIKLLDELRAEVRATAGGGSSNEPEEASSYSE